MAPISKSSTVEDILSIISEGVVLNLKTNYYANLYHLLANVKKTSDDE